MDSFINHLVELAERPDAQGRSLADRIRDSYDAELEIYDGFLVHELTKMIDAVVHETPAEEVRSAYNVLAEQEGLDPLEEGEELCGPYSDMFVEAVMDEIGSGKQA